MIRSLKKAVVDGLQVYSDIYGKELSKKCHYHKFIRKVEFLLKYGTPHIVYGETDISVHIIYNGAHFSINYDYSIPNWVVIIKSVVEVLPH